MTASLLNNLFINEFKATLDCAEFIKRAEITHKVTTPLVASVLPCDDCFLLLLSLSTSERSQIKCKVASNKHQVTWYTVNDGDCTLWLWEYKLPLYILLKNATLILRQQWGARRTADGNLHLKVTIRQFPVNNIDTSACVIFSFSPPKQF